jgi:aromatic ring-opening dioxygenase catalytic subunit (LigB family)
MGEIVTTIAVSHAPGLTGWLDKATEEEQDNMNAGYDEMGRILRAAEPDVIIGIANDHVLNLPLSSGIDFCVGTADSWSGPADWFKDWLNVPDYTVKGNRDVARTLVNEGSRDGLNLAFKDELLFDDNWTVPLTRLTPDYDIPLVPIHMNCIVPPIPTAQTCYDFGKSIADIVRDHRPDGERVALMATGGMSHDPGGPKYFEIDDEFDRWFLDLLTLGDPEKVIAETTLERLAAAGDGGTAELLAWIAAMGAVGDRKAQVISYTAPLALRCGMGCVVWDMSE